MVVPDRAGKQVQVALQRYGIGMGLTQHTQCVTSHEHFLPNWIQSILRFPGGSNRKGNRDISLPWFVSMYLRAQQVLQCYYCCAAETVRQTASPGKVLAEKRLVAHCMKLQFFIVFKPFRSIRELFLVGAVGIQLTYGGGSSVTCLLGFVLKKGDRKHGLSQESLQVSIFSRSIVI